MAVWVMVILVTIITMVDMGNTTNLDTAMVIPTAKSLLVLTSLALVSIGVLILSWPRFQASFIYLPVDTAISRFYESSEIPLQQIPALIIRAEQTIEQHDHYRYQEGLSLLSFLYGMDSRSPTLETRPALEKSLSAAAAAVAMAPVRPGTWQRIAAIHAVLNHEPERIINALNMSIYTGRIERTLLIERLVLGSRYQEWLDTETETLLVDQALLTWKLLPAQFTRAVKGQRINWLALKQLLSDRHLSVVREIEVSLEPF